MSCQNFWRTSEVDEDVHSADLQLGEKKKAEPRIQYYFHFDVRKGSLTIV